MLQSLLNTFNPWWVSARVPEELVGKPRTIFGEIKSSLKLRQITILTGLRRVGKTTLLFQLVDALLKEKVNPYQILYFSFDESQFALDEILDFYQHAVLQKNLREGGKIHIFLDEIQKLSQWPEKIKIFYDLYPNIKFVLSGSARILLFRGSRESLAGRFFEFPVEPLDFYEYLQFRNKTIDFSREAVFKTTLVTEFQGFLKSGGFIEAMELNDLQRLQYFKEAILERVVFKDIPQNFSVKKPGLLFQLLEIVAFQPGLYLDYKNIANDLKMDQRTIADYFSLLDYALLVQKLFNFSTNKLTSEKKMKRIYLSNVAFTQALHPPLELPSILEQFWINCLKTRFFYRSPRKDEVDIVLENGGNILPIEIKIRENIAARDASALFVFLNRFGGSAGLMITLNTEGLFERNHLRVQLIPYWKYQTILQFINKQLGNSAAKA